MGILSRATRNIVRKKRRTALILIVLSISIALMLTLPASIDANQQASQKIIDKNTKEIEQWSAQLNGVATEIDFNVARIPDFNSNSDRIEGYQNYPLVNLTDYYGKLCLVPDVEKVVPVFRETQWAPGREYYVGEEYHEELAEYLYDVYGVPLEADLVSRFPSVLPSNVTVGRNLVAGDRGVVVLNEVVAGNWSVGVGDTVKVLGETFTVVGIQGEGVMGLDARTVGVFMGLEEAQRITNNSGKVSFFQIFADNAGNVESIEATLRSLYPTNVIIITATYVRNDAQQIIDVTSNASERIQTTMSQIQSSAWVGAVLAVVVQGAVIFVIMTYSVRERTKEIGTLKAMGSSSVNILGQFVLEGALLSLIAGLIGITITLVGASQLGHFVLPNFNVIGIDLIVPGGITQTQPVAVSIAPQLLLAGLGVAVLLGVLGSLYPALKASRTRPAETMHYE
ncbi:MAG: FtsX-like permease family protein [Candidatus Bathyarchaeota archaeon]|uniref:ABC transporter permease n=1 Tax=Candidatus Bathycorpusculum sp. TaxID=2994959 RepID=UPI002817C75E|nr:FtsX-like permease family protein [Candidatus Termiticorpusculum sp.]MCL2256628.1 FtsX-like permease family protein [Candidatus Termiticorpusculum sp.]MCL2293193.1 FtsX-like permease family protein [Candidatus Termiticorpusculum sp.]